MDSSDKSWSAWLGDFNSFLQYLCSFDGWWKARLVAITNVHTPGEHCSFNPYDGGNLSEFWQRNGFCCRIDLLAFHLLSDTGFWRSQVYISTVIIMNLSHAIFRIISDIDKVHLDGEKKSVYSSIVKQIQKSESFDHKYLRVIENRIEGFFDKITDEEKIKLYNETEKGMIDPIDIENAIISQVELDLTMELLDEVTKELFDYVERSQNGNEI